MRFLEDCFMADQYTVTQPALGKIRIQYRETESSTASHATAGASAGAGCITAPFTPSHPVSLADSSLNP